MVLSSRLYEAQSHLMLTSHIMSAQVIVINEKAWQGLDPELRGAIGKAAQEVRKRASETVRTMEAWELSKLKSLGMTVVGPENGLKLDTFKIAVGKLVNEKFAAKYGTCTRKLPPSTDLVCRCCLGRGTFPGSGYNRTMSYCSCR